MHVSSRWLLPNDEWPGGRPSIAGKSHGGRDRIAFLAPLGFSLQERWVPGGESFRDGWRLTFSSPKIEVIVQYIDAQFEVHFARGGLAVSYLEMDRDLFGRRSGFHGDMFPPSKLEAAIHRIAEDIRQNYGPTLTGEEGAWNQIERLRAEPPRAPRLP
jgi:hypothetical protein